MIHAITHFFLHIFGIDTQQSPFYDFWSGIATQCSVIFAAVTYYKKHNCHVKLCLRVGKYSVGPYLVCAKHHPILPDVTLSADVEAEYQEGDKL